MAVKEAGIMMIGSANFHEPTKVLCHKVLTPHEDTVQI